MHRKLHHESAFSSLSSLLSSLIGIVDTSVPLAIGRDGGGGSYFGDMADDVAIYASALTTAQIQQLYAQGLKNYRIAAQ